MFSILAKSTACRQNREGEKTTHASDLILDVIILNNSQEKSAVMPTQGSVLHLKDVISNLGFKSILEA